MKKVTLILALFAAFLSNAQISKGSMVVGTGILYTNISGSDNTTTYSNVPTVYSSSSNSFGISLNPNVGYFISDGLAVGGQFYLSYYKQKSNSSNTSSTTTSTSDYSSTSLSVGPMVRYYFVKSGKWAPYVQGDFAYNLYPSKSTSTSSTGSSSTSDTKSKTNWDTGFRLGMEYFISDYVGLQFYAGYSYAKRVYETEYKPSSGTGYTYTSDSKSWTIPIGVGLQIHLPSGSSGSSK